ncbi:MAG: hypothetical protein M1834_003480 [Cirrosporium novae-zelandiae]|nr:MAG: hypothetical protein M1834_003480 [Cirrosporium novae-zelandiae]
MAGPEIRYTVFIRLPFSRPQGFVDPAPTNWTAARDKELWDAISRKDGDIDWQALAERFNVPLSFLSQVAAWLYQRQLSEMRAQMRRIGAAANTTASAANSPIPPDMSDGSGSLSAVAMKRTASGGSRVPSSLSMRHRDSPIPRGDISGSGSGISIPARVKPPPLSRTASRNTIIQARSIAPQASHLEQTSSLQSRQSQRLPLVKKRSISGNKPETSKKEKEAEKELIDSPAVGSTSPDSDSSINSSSSEPSKVPAFLHRSRFLPRKTRAKRSPMEEDISEDEDDESPAFLPFSNTGTQPQSLETSPNDPSATLRLEKPAGNTRSRGPSTSIAANRAAVIAASQTTTASSSNSSVVSVPPNVSQNDGSQNTRPWPSSQQGGMLSPRRTAELAGLSPRRRPQQAPGSDTGTPSMGSSFSDLDDASVTQSALEEALLSNMQHGGVTSRMSTISQAFRSRYGRF